MPSTKVMPRGKRPPRAAAAVSKAINNVLLGDNNQAAAAQPGPSQPGPSAPRPSFSPRNPRFRPSSGIGVKNIRERIRDRNRAIKIKKLLPQSKAINVKKNGVILHQVVVRRKTYFRGRRARTY